ncbi:MAG: hypothetical protein C0467_05615 [Planctomycetaceae bacterium]|nr:hypothetical protein [Planctomycetaceae bacterium]
MRLSSVCVALLLTALPASAGELRVYPPKITLSGPNRTQQLLVVEEVNRRVVKDHTASTTFRSSDEKVAKVNAAGVVTAVGKGSATISIALEGGRTAPLTTVSVAGFDKPSEWSFRNHVVPVLTRTACNSGACHGALAGKGGLKLSLRGFDPESDWFVLTRQALARRVDQTNPAESLLLKKGARLMPHGGGTRFTDGDENYTLLLDWIKSGAHGPRDSDVSLERIEVFPPAALLKPKDKIRVIARAVYSDGTNEDVTRWAKFTSSEDLVAGVNEDGGITVTGSGEAAIIVNFGTKVTTLSVTVPFPNEVNAAAFARPAGSGFIDDLILTKLELLRLPPSGLCTDAEFIRRAFLDTCGILPPVEETKAFLADKDSKKREKLIDKLLERPEFADYWAYRWSDLLLVSSRRLQQPAMWAFYRKIRQSVADNQPWDKFARGILTASGSSLSEGGGNYFVLHKDVAALAEATAITFLGTGIGCAKCHNHPLEKWTQDEYWAFANLFSRVGLKNGDRPGEVLVQSRLDGEALHLRRGVAMPPMPLDGKPLALDAATDRRAYFADWLTAPNNPFFAKAVVNRIWRNYMGRGLVEAEDDLRVSNPASNIELLDALAADFVKNRFDMKRLMRSILGSAAYQRSSQPLPANAADDRFYSRYLVRRLPAEVILDAYSDLTGVPTLFNQIKTAAGDSASAVTTYPAGTRAMQLPDSLLLSRFLEAFGRADRVATCACERTADASVTQALHLNNGITLNDKLRDKQSIVTKWLDAKLTDAEIVDCVFLAALTREPTSSEKKRFVALLAESEKYGPKSRREGIEDFVWAVLTGREFLFNH